MSNPIADAKMERMELALALHAAGCAVDSRGNCRCPNPEHPDKRPSAGIFQGDDGGWRVHCRACEWSGDVFDVRALASGRDAAEEMRQERARRGSRAARPTRKAATPKADPARDWSADAERFAAAITDEQVADLAGKLGLSSRALRRLGIGWDGRVFTFPMQDGAGNTIGIRTREPGGAKKAITGSHAGVFLPAGPRDGWGPLCIAEGPTDTAALLDMGVDAIGRPSNNGGEDYIVEYLKRTTPREVLIVIDNDSKPAVAEATEAAAQRLAQRLAPMVDAVKVIRPPAGCKDAREWRQSGAALDDIEAAADAVTPNGAASALGEQIEDEISGKRRVVPLPWRSVSFGSQATLPGAIVLLCAGAGSGKSLATLQLLADLHDAGIPWAAYEIEGDVAFHLRRMLAQRVRASWLTDIEEVAKRPDEARAYFAEHRDWLDSVGRRIAVAPAAPPTLRELATWVEQRTRDGARLIVVDPITLAAMTDRPWEDASRFLATVGPIIADAGASLWLVTHPAKTGNRPAAPTLDALAGGAAWARFAHTVLWLQAFPEPREMLVKPYLFPRAEPAEVRHIMHILKARNGRGTGWRLAFHLDHASLRFDERGAIVKAAQKAVEITDDED